MSETKTIYNTIEEAFSIQTIILLNASKKFAF